jgi:hypothetical protein
VRFFSTGHPQDFHRLSTRVDDLEKELQTLKTTLKLAKTEWDDVYDKVSRQVERMRKRSLVPLQDAQEGQENASPPIDGYFRHRLLAEAKRRGQ